MDKLKINKDDRGNLFALDFSKVPFEPKRFFTVYDVPKNESRGKHAHKNCKQYLICIEGDISISCYDGNIEDIKHFDMTEGDAVFIDKMTWSEQRYNTGNDILVVLCSEEYDKEDYITNPVFFELLVT